MRSRPLNYNYHWGGTPQVFEREYFPVGLSDFEGHPAQRMTATGVWSDRPCRSN